MHRSIASPILMDPSVSATKITPAVLRGMPENPKLVFHPNFFALDFEGVGENGLGIVCRDRIFTRF
jgi:hypothetical protein